MYYFIINELQFQALCNHTFMYFVRQLIGQIMRTIHSDLVLEIPTW